MQNHPKKTTNIAIIRRQTAQRYHGIIPTQLKPSFYQQTAQRYHGIIRTHLKLEGHQFGTPAAAISRNCSHASQVGGIRPRFNNRTRNEPNNDGHVPKTSSVSQQHTTSRTRNDRDKHEHA